MISYYCIVNLPGAPAREIAALCADDDDEAKAEAGRLADRWPGFETVVLYDGERAVDVLANPALGFAVEPLCPPSRAA